MKNHPLFDISCSPAKLPTEPCADRKQRDTALAFPSFRSGPICLNIDFRFERPDESIDRFPAVFISYFRFAIANARNRLLLLFLFTSPQSQPLRILSFLFHFHDDPCSCHDFASFSNRDGGPCSSRDSFLPLK